MPDIDDLLAHRRKMNKPKKLGKETTTQKVEEFDLIKEGEKLLGKVSSSSKPISPKSTSDVDSRAKSKLDVSKKDISNLDAGEVQNDAEVFKTKAKSTSESDVSKSDISSLDESPDLMAEIESHALNRSAIVQSKSDTSKLDISKPDYIKFDLADSGLTTLSNMEVSDSEVSDSDLSDLETSVMDTSKKYDSRLDESEIDISDLEESRAATANMEVSNRDASKIDTPEKDISNLNRRSNPSSKSDDSEIDTSKSDVSVPDTSQKDVDHSSIIDRAGPESVNAAVARAGASRLDTLRRTHELKVNTSDSDASNIDVELKNLNEDVLAVSATLMNLAKSQLGLREMRAAIYLLAKAKGQKNIELQYTNPEISDATNCHTSHISGVMSALEEMGFLSKKRGKGNEKSSYTLL